MRFIALYCIFRIRRFVSQVTWDGEWQDGTGRTSGEEVEQTNSFISRLGSTTKHMLPESK